MTKRKYIDSHWLVFIFQGIVALFFGCLTLFTSNNSSFGVIPVIGVALLALAVVEFANSLQRTRSNHGWLVATLVAVFDAAFGITLIIASDQDAIWHLCLLASYTVFRGIFELILGFRTTVDPTDRFIWVLCGLCGIVFGIVILNSGHLPGVDFIRFFGAYLLIFGVCSLIYGKHNRTQQHDAIEASERRAKKSSKSVSAKSSKSGKKIAK